MARASSYSLVGAEHLVAMTDVVSIEGPVELVNCQLAKMLRIGAGSLVVIDNRNGKFTITRGAANDRGIH